MLDLPSRQSAADPCIRASAMMLLARAAMMPCRAMSSTLALADPGR